MSRKHRHLSYLKITFIISEVTPEVKQSSLCYTHCMYLGIDIGGTKTLVASFNDDGTIADQVKFATPQDYQSFLSDLVAHLDQLPTKEFVYCGVGMPGIIDRDNGVSKWAGGNLGWAENCPLAADIGGMVGCPVAIENDANLAGLSEANLIRDQYRTALYLTVSTGIGGVLIIDGVIDPHTINSEVGHMLYPAEGGYKTWEELTSGKAIVDKYGQRAAEISDPETWRAISEKLAVGLINLSAVLTPQVIIIGGGVGANLNRFQTYLDEQLQKLKPSGVVVPPVVKAQRPEEAVIYGCYTLAKEKRGHGPIA